MLAYCATCAAEKPCKTCEAIENAGKAKWCFQWLRQLKDYGACLETEKAERDRQVRLMVNHTDDKVIDIRYKLAILQTQTVRSMKDLQNISMI
jgi:hypothetical protein